MRTILLLLFLTFPISAHAERLALVIGNADFERSTDLPQTAEDARAMADKLNDLGFRLIGDRAHVNLTRAEMLRQIRALGREASPGDEVVFYFSGHGIGGTQTNYLIPVNDGEIETKEDVSDLAVDLASILDRLPKEGEGVNILILDACRDSPLPSGAKSAFAPKGLISVSRGSPNNVVLYAAEPGERAYVSDSGRSYFTDAFLESVDTPKQNLTELIREVRARVFAQTADKFPPQLPTIEGVPAAPFFFNIARYETGMTFQDCNECPEMVAIPAGATTMGSFLNEFGRDASEGPPRTVTIDYPLAVGKYEVTWDEWEACIADKGCSSQGSEFGGDFGWGKGRLPVITVSWFDAKDYVLWLKRKTNEDYRLLSEAEWEYAARAGTTSTFFWGDDPNLGCDYANVIDEAVKEEKHTGYSSNYFNCNDGFVHTAPVGSFLPNAFGLYDMYGNVWEWVEDCHEPSIWPKSSDAFLSGRCKNRVRRGGSWENTAPVLRSARRDGLPPTFEYHNTGFRVARPLPN